MRGKRVVLIAWWLYVYTQTIVSSANPAYGYLAWHFRRAGLDNPGA